MQNSDKPSQQRTFWSYLGEDKEATKEVAIMLRTPGHENFLFQERPVAMSIDLEVVNGKSTKNRQRAAIHGGLFQTAPYHEPLSHAHTLQITLLSCVLALPLWRLRKLTRSIPDVLGCWHFSSLVGLIYCSCRLAGAMSQHQWRKEWNVRPGTNYIEGAPRFK